MSEICSTLNKASTNLCMLASVSCKEETKLTFAKKYRWKKPKDMPKRPLSAYNLFFQHTRNDIMKGLDNTADLNKGIGCSFRTTICANYVPKTTLSSNMKNTPNGNRRRSKMYGRISFGDLARTVAEKWKKTPPKGRAFFETQALAEKVRYKGQLDLWRERKSNPEVTGTQHSLVPQTEQVAPLQIPPSTKQAKPENTVRDIPVFKSDQTVLPLASRSLLHMSSLLLQHFHSVPGTQIHHTQLLPCRSFGQPRIILSDQSQSCVAKTAKPPAFKKNSSRFYLSSIEDSIVDFLLELPAQEEDHEGGKISDQEGDERSGKDMMRNFAFDPTPIRENATPQNVGANAIIPVNDSFCW